MTQHYKNLDYLWSHWGTATDAVMTLALEKLYDDYGLVLGDEVVITKKKSLDKVTKFEILKTY